ncbi:hypothetical protein B296_00046370 [Ensete ventricosum]|uniref:Retrotransposon gag domain-containing protein n=1 Tax=Ensete ventricosum TaxID=4639 RepID=A0A426XWL5_ENSVE|nr:hypothetical protein B296_00046370 [Ensete ventricosum]
MFNIAAIHLEGDAILQNDWFEHTHGMPMWRQFKSELLTRFGPSEHENKGRLLVIEPINDSKPKNVDLVSEEEDVDEELQPTVSTVHALAGYANPQTIKIDEFRKHQPITVLINTGSTNNFMDNKAATRLTLRIEDCSRFDVKGEALVNRGKGKASTAMVAGLQQEGAMGPTKEEDGCSGCCQCHGKEGKEAVGAGGSDNGSVAAGRRGWGLRDADPTEQKQGRRKRAEVMFDEHHGVVRGPWSAASGNNNSRRL